MPDCFYIFLSRVLSLVHRSCEESVRNANKEKNLLYFLCCCCATTPWPSRVNLKFSPDLAEEEQGSEIQDGGLTL